MGVIEAYADEELAVASEIELHDTAPAHNVSAACF
jgi:hypothetical protein